MTPKLQRAVERILAKAKNRSFIVVDNKLIYVGKRQRIKEWRKVPIAGRVPDFKP